MICQNFLTKKTADMDRDGVHYFPDGAYYRLRPVHTCEAKIVTQRLARRQLVTRTSS